MGESQSSYLSHRGCNNTDVNAFRWYRDHASVLIGVNCKKCDSEWLTESVGREEYRKKENISVGQTALHLMQKPSDDSVIPTDYTEITDLHNLAGSLTAGDHIIYQLDANLYHHAIVKRVEDMGPAYDKIIVIHMQIGGENDESKATIISEGPVDDMDKKTVIYKLNYDGNNKLVDERSLTLARAEAWVGEIGFGDGNLTEKDCENFAFFCKTGIHPSRLVEDEKALAEVVRVIVPYRDEPIDNVADLSVGDQVVMFKKVLHPRCHMIVTSVDPVGRKIGVIRLTFARGVVEEEFMFRKPMFKVITESPYSAQEVIGRAKNPISTKYNIFLFNCKHFAFWCKTDKIPKSP